MNKNQKHRAYRKLYLFSLILGVGLNATPALASVGCPWVSSARTNEVVDGSASYWTAQLPTNFAPGTTIQIDSAYPKVRYFGYTLYHSGLGVDHLADGNLVPTEGGPANPNVAAIPYSNDYADTYRLTIKFEDAPASREPNVLYAGTDATLSREIMLRTYLPNPGFDGTGGVALPQFTQVNPDGSTVPFDANNLHCIIYASIKKVVKDINLPSYFFVPKQPAFKIVPLDTYNKPALGLIPPYSNFDNGYGFVYFSTAKWPIGVIRFKMPLVPSSGADPASLQARYISLCENLRSNRALVGCLNDSQLTVQDDGYVNLVLSLPADRPVYADATYGYDWMASTATPDASVVTMRQLLALPDFAGNFQNAGQTTNPLATLGEWAPLATYCDATTFSNNALLGGAALFSACQAATK